MLCFYTYINFRKFVITRRQFICITHRAAGEDIENKVWFSFNAIKDSTLFQVWFWQGTKSKRYLNSQRSAHASLLWFYTGVPTTFCKIWPCYCKIALYYVILIWYLYTHMRPRCHNTSQQQYLDIFSWYMAIWFQEIALFSPGWGLVLTRWCRLERYFAGSFDNLPLFT